MPTIGTHSRPEPVFAPIITDRRDGKKLTLLILGLLLFFATCTSCGGAMAFGVMKLIGG